MVNEGTRASVEILIGRHAKARPWRAGRGGVNKGDDKLSADSLSKIGDLEKSALGAPRGIQRIVSKRIKTLELRVWLCVLRVLPQQAKRRGFVRSFVPQSVPAWGPLPSFLVNAHSKEF